MVRTLLLVRHAESEWNERGIYQGRLESELSALGHRQAEALALRLAGRQLTAIYTSPLRRSLQTAEIVAGTGRPQPGPRTLASGPPIVQRPELLEIDHGQWSGRTRAEVAARWPELFEQWQRHPAAVRMPGGESLLDVRRRALGFLAWARQEHADGELLVLTHGTVLRLLLGYFLELPADRVWSVQAENCALSLVDDYEVPLIMAINDGCHLDGVRSSLHAQVF